MAEDIFSYGRIVTDTRVSPVLDTCLACGDTLPDKQTTSGDSDVMLLFAQCRTCKHVYVLDCADFNAKSFRC